MQRGDIYLAPFPYTDLAHTKRRPVCIVSDSGFNTGHDVVVAMITSRPSRRTNPGVGDFAVVDWQQTGLLNASAIRAGRLWTSEKRLLGARLGTLSDADIARLDQALSEVLGLTAS